MRLSLVAKNVMLDALDETAVSGAGAKFASLHSLYSATGTPGELAGGSPSYARQPATWNPANSGAKGITSAIAFPVPAGAFVRFIGFWDALTGGNFLGMSPNGGGIPQAFVVPNAINDTLECVGHGLVPLDTVVVWAFPGDPLPSGLTEGTVYFVSGTGHTADHLLLSTISGGGTIDLLAMGAGYLQKIAVEQFTGQGVHTVTSVTMTMD